MEIVEGGGLPLSSAFDVEKGVTAFVGGGGKTTCMLRLAHALSAFGRVLVTTSTHIFPPTSMPVLSNPTVSEVRAALLDASPVCIGRMESSGKLAASSIPFETLETLADYVLVEADGAKGKPLKAPADHEPVLPENTSLVIAVAGLDGIGRAVSDAAFRPELYADVLGKEPKHIVTPKDAAKVLCDDRGQHKNVSAWMRFAVLLNKADTAAHTLLAREVVDELPASIVSRVVIASCKEKETC